jgi:hypothetical protein
MGFARVADRGAGIGVSAKEASMKTQRVLVGLTDGPASARPHDVNPTLVRASTSDRGVSRTRRR